ncbi:hypothetical protein COX08_02580 [Candidatus Beckwithbacteria bacterium CG23_combo_of_CG06-09_8_20_14_all_34_8]|uniref:Uncharacterized protein n=1 Tax=Candidatus Beckwithbacteria bacterium CG23_combo_of_CG06-09_8_20_14_all_34_8 TaxID=1974497 RepID=A0A2H0B6A5_9BACT|nr:MAG: hypothetical protein COX08_02580 [Candidatus Beckwithbacteria bacterium CG23_combo_of_CG06-09_8_20_14_all_34_8]
MYPNNMTHEQLTPSFANTGSDTQPIKENFFSRQSCRSDSMRAEWEAYLRGKYTPEEAKFKFNHQAHEENPPDPEFLLRTRILSPGEEVTLVELPDWAV